MIYFIKNYKIKMENTIIINFLNKNPRCMFNCLCSNKDCVEQYLNYDGPEIIITTCNNKEFHLTSTVSFCLKYFKKFPTDWSEKIFDVNYINILFKNLLFNIRGTHIIIGKDWIEYNEQIFDKDKIFEFIKKNTHDLFPLIFNMINYYISIEYSLDKILKIQHIDMAYKYALVNILLYNCFLNCSYKFIDHLTIEKELSKLYYADIKIGLNGTNLNLQQLSLPENKLKTKNDLMIVSNVFKIDSKLKTLLNLINYSKIINIDTKTFLEYNFKKQFDLFQTINILTNIRHCPYELNVIICRQFKGRFCMRSCINIVDIMDENNRPPLLTKYLKYLKKEISSLLESEIEQLLFLKISDIKWNSDTLATFNYFAPEIYNSDNYFTNNSLFVEINI
jgi:hypothetical protein